MTHDEWIAQTPVPDIICKDLWRYYDDDDTAAIKKMRSFGIDEVHEELKHGFALAERTLCEIGTEEGRLDGLYPAWFDKGLRELVNDGRYNPGNKTMQQYHDDVARCGAFFSAWAVEQWTKYFCNEAYAAIERNKDKEDASEDVRDV